MNRHAAPPTVRTSALEELARAAAIRRGRRVELVPRTKGGPVARGVLLRDVEGSALVLWDDGAISGCRTQFLKRNTDPVEEVSALSGMTLEQAGRAFTEASRTLGGAGRWVVKDRERGPMERAAWRDAERRGLHTHAPDGSNRDCKRCAMLRARLGL